MAKVWIVLEEHRAEGASVLGVFAYEPPQAEIDSLDSLYSINEQARWCKRHAEPYEVIQSGTSTHPD